MDDSQAGPSLTAYASRFLANRMGDRGRGVQGSQVCVIVSQLSTDLELTSLIRRYSDLHRHHHLLTTPLFLHHL